jgi:hypothetical protein
LYGSLYVTIFTRNWKRTELAKKERKQLVRIVPAWQKGLEEERRLRQLKRFTETNIKKIKVRTEVVAVVY